MLKDFLKLLGVVLITPFFLVTASALEFNAPGIPVSITLTGADAGNVTSGITKVDLTNFYPTAVVSNAEFSLVQKTAISAGNVKIYDNYSYSMSPSIAYIGEFDATDARSYKFNCYAHVKNWLSNPGTNQGLLLKASDLDAEANLVIESFNFKLEFTLPDKVSPNLIGNPESQKTADTKYRITAKADEPVTAILEFGKTSNYGEALSQNSLSTDIQFEILEVQENVTYHYRLKITDAAGNTTVTKNFSFQTISAETPTLIQDEQAVIDLRGSKVEELNVQLTEVSGEYAVKLTWPALNEDRIDGYIILRKDSLDDDYEELTRINNNISTYLDLQIILGQELQYKIIAFNDQSESSGLESKRIVIPDVKPSNTGEESPNVSLFFFLGIAITAFVFYLVYKLGGRFKALFQQKNKSTQLENVFRDPTMVDEQI